MATETSNLSEKDDSIVDLSNKFAIGGCGLALISTFFTWYSVSVPFVGTVNLSGINTDPGIIVTIGSLFVVTYLFNTRGKVIAPMLIVLGGVIGLYYALTTAVASIGIGLFLAVVAGVIVSYGRIR